MRKRIEEGFGWIKTVGNLRWLFTLTAAACNLVRLPKLLAAA